MEIWFLGSGPKEGNVLSVRLFVRPPPRQTSGPPAMLQGPLARMQGPPARPQGLPVRPQGLPARPQGPQAWPQGPPAMPQGASCQASGVPVSPQGSTAKSQESPVGSRGHQPGRKSFPPGPKGISQAPILPARLQGPSPRPKTSNQTFCQVSGVSRQAPVIFSQALGATIQAPGAPSQVKYLFSKTIQY